MDIWINYDYEHLETLSWIFFILMEQLKMEKKNYFSIPDKGGMYGKRRFIDRFIFKSQI
jgi:hypothetical protein